MKSNICYPKFTYHEGIVERSEYVSNSEVLFTLLLGDGGDLLNCLFLLIFSLTLEKVTKNERNTHGIRR